MALGDEGIEGKDHGDEGSSVNGRVQLEHSRMLEDEEKTRHGAEGEDDEDEENEDEDDEDEDEEDEPRLKYTSLTKNLKSLYRNGDATSAFLVAGDKMVRTGDYILCQQAKC